MSLPFDQKIYVSRNVVIQRYPVISGMYLTFFAALWPAYQQKPFACAFAPGLNLSGKAWCHVNG